jgi:hypothetical protein
MLTRTPDDQIRGDEGYIATDIKKSVSLGPNPADLYEGIFRDIGPGAHDPARPDVPFDIRVPQGFDNWQAVHTRTRPQLHEGVSEVFVELNPPRLPDEL